MNDEQLLRYSRQIMLPAFDVAGQQALLNATVLIIGAGGLGCPAAMYLAAAGVGKLILVDDDQVELSNLQRQILHQESDIGRDKVISARDSLRSLNSDIEVETHTIRLTEDNLQSILHSVDDSLDDSGNENTAIDLVIDACDNFSTRFMINRACIAAGLPLVSGAAIRMEGQVAVFDTRHAQSPCYQCLYQEGDDEQMSCARNGVMSPLVGLIGSYQALEAIKVLAGVGKSLCGRLQLFDGMTSQWRELKLSRDPACPACANRPVSGQNL